MSCPGYQGLTLSSLAVTDGLIVLCAGLILGQVMSVLCIIPGLLAPFIGMKLTDALPAASHLARTGGQIEPLSFAPQT